MSSIVPYAPPLPLDEAMPASAGSMLVTLSEEAREQLGKRIREVLDPADVATNEIRKRWTRNTEFYHDNPANAVETSILGGQMLHFPLVSPRIDSLTVAVMETIFSQDPVCRPEFDGPDQEIDLAESILEYFAKYAHLEDVVERASPIAGCTNCAILRVMWDEEKGCPHIDTIHPTNFVIFDPNIHDLDSAPLVGHEYSRSSAEVAQLIDQGRFYDGVKLNVEPSRIAESRQGEGDKVVAGSATHPADQAVVFKELVQILNIKDIEGHTLEELASGEVDPGEYKRYLVTYAKETFQVCAVEDYDLSISNYSDFRYLPQEPGNWWPSYSVANKLQGLQEQYNHINNLMIRGSYVAAFPPVARVSALGPTKNQKYGPADIIDQAMAGSATPMVTRFDPGALPMMISQIERNADAVVGVSQAGQGVQFQDKRTLGENQMVQQGADKRLGGYIRTAGQCIERIYQIMAEMLALKESEWSAKHGPNIAGYQPGMGAAVLQKATRWTVQGRSPDQSPEVQAQKMGMLLEVAMKIGPQPEQLGPALLAELVKMAMNPMMAQAVVNQAMMAVGGPIDVMEIVRTIVNLTGAPNKAQIMKDTVKQNAVQQPNGPGAMGAPSPVPALMPGGGGLAGGFGAGNDPGGPGIPPGPG